MAEKLDPLQEKLNELMAQCTKDGVPDSDAFMEAFLEHNRKARAESAFTKIMKDVEALYPPDKWDYQKIIRDKKIPVGHRRMVAVYFSTADIANGGFTQFFGNGFGCLCVPAIEAYEKSGQTEIANLMKKAMKICLEGEPLSGQWSALRVEEFQQAVKETDFQVPDGFLDGVTTGKQCLEDLDEKFYSLDAQLPGASELPTGYPDGFITWYYNRFPEDFVFSK